MRRIIALLLAFFALAAQAQGNIKPEIAVLHTDRSSKDYSDWADCIGIGASFRLNEANDLRALVVAGLSHPDQKLLSNDPKFYATRTKDYRALEVCYRHAIGGSFPWRPVVGVVLAATSVHEESSAYSQAPYSTQTNTVNGANIAFYAGYCLGSSATIEIQIGVRKSVGLSWRF